MYDNKIKTFFLQKTKNFNADLALEEVLCDCHSLSQRAQITKLLVSLKILVLGPMLIRLFLLVLIYTTCYQIM